MSGDSRITQDPLHHFAMSNGQGDDMTYIRLPIVQAADWVGLVAMSATTVILGYKLLAFKPPPSANATRKYVSYVPQ